MALIKCPECNKEVSDKAKTCIHCGYPLDEYVAQQYVKHTSDNTICIINDKRLDFSNVTILMQEWKNAEAMQEIINIVNQSGLDISVYSKINLVEEIMENFRIPKTYEILSNKEYFDRRLQLEANNYICYIHYTPYDLSDIKEQIDKFNGVTISGCKRIRNIPKLTKNEASDLIMEMNKYKYIPLSFPEDFDDVYPKLITNSILDKLEKRYDQMHPEEYTEQPPQHIQPAQNVPHCPNCGSENIKKISFTSRAVGVMAVGLLSSSIGKTFKCKSCGYKW